MSRRSSDPPSTSKRGVRRTRPSAREHQPHSPPSDPAALPHRSAMTAQDWYRTEKARRGRDRAQDLVDEARREYLALLASEAGGPKGGRPRKVGRPKKVGASRDEDLLGPLDLGADALGPDEFEAGDAGHRRGRGRSDVEKL